MVQFPDESTGSASTAEPENQAEESHVVAEDVEALISERDDLKDQLLRAHADYQNLRRRFAQEKEELRRYATEALVRDLLPVLDNFERSIAALEQGADPDAVREGIRAIDRQFRAVLEGVKLERIHAVGEPFDPERHEAIALEASNEHPEDTVIAEIEPGYRLNDRVIRPARVKVARNQ
jgi:molecular chaperone GrpE